MAKNVAQIQRKQDQMNSSLYKKTGGEPNAQAQTVAVARPKSGLSRRQGPR